MTLVIAYIGRNGAAIAGDMREITFGTGEGTRVLEEELYSGRIRTDEDLARRAGELGVYIQVRDDKIKVERRDDGILTGEVTKSDKGTIYRRRVYAAPGTYAIVEFEGELATSVQKKSGPAFVVLGNEIGKKITNEVIAAHWRHGTMKDAIRIMVLALERAGRTTASVGRTFSLEQTDAGADPHAAADADAGT